VPCALIADVVDEVWVLELPVEVAKQRLMNRNSLSEADVRRKSELISHETHTWTRLTLDLLCLLQALQRINSQLSNEERTKGAHVVISADGTPDEVKARVHEEWQKFLERKHVHPKP
jgi:dephospho-CoA kinase